MRETGGAEPSHAELAEHIRVEVAERAGQLAEERGARAAVEAAEVALELGGAVPRLQPDKSFAQTLGAELGENTTSEPIASVSEHLTSVQHPLIELHSLLMRSKPMVSAGAL